MKHSSVTDDLISRYISGEIKPEEQHVLLGWLNESPENEKQLFVLKDIYEGAAKERLFNEAQTSEGWEQLQHHWINHKKQNASTRHHKTIQWITQIGKYAAVLLIGVSSTIACFHFFAQQTPQQKVDILTYSTTTDKGERATVTLPDGSIVRLNACSSLSYQSNYGEDNRDVIFSGEAFFDIRTNPEMPFAVKTSGLNIKAYGTAFNVKSYVDEDVVETTLVNGRVIIENQATNQIITLEPNQVIAIPVTTASKPKNGHTNLASNKQPAIKTLPKNTLNQEAVLRKNVKTEEFTSWKDDKWIVKSESLESLAKKIERRYDVSIHIEDEASKKYIFSGTLRNYPLEQVLDIIRLNAPIQYVISGKTIRIKEEKQLKKQYQQLIQSE